MKKQAKDLILHYVNDLGPIAIDELVGKVTYKGYSERFVRLEMQRLVEQGKIKFNKDMHLIAKRKPKAKKPAKKVKEVCPKCEDKGYYLVTRYAGTDFNDEPRYYKSIEPCFNCKEIVVLTKKKYRG